MAHLEMPTKYRQGARAYAKSVVVHGRTIFPLDPETVAGAVTSAIWEAQTAAFALGVEAARAEMREALGIQ